MISEDTTRRVNTYIERTPELVSRAIQYGGVAGVGYSLHTDRPEYFGLGLCALALGVITEYMQRNPVVSDPKDQ